MPESFNKKIFLILLLFCFNFSTNTNAATTGPFGSEAAPSIVYPFGLLPANNATNIIKAFGYTRPGFSLSDYTTTCTWQSVFPIAGPISLNNGTMYLESDLKLTNTGTLATTGTFWGNNHAIKLSQATNSFTLGDSSVQAQTLNLVSRVTTVGSVTINSIDWSYDSKYVAIATTTTGSGNNLHIYYFDGTNLTFKVAFRTTGTATCVRWHPSAYYIALTNTLGSGQLRVFLYNATLNTLTAAGSASPGAASGLSWHSSGSFISIAPSSGTTIRIYSYNGTTLTSVATRALSPTRTFNGNCMRWGPKSFYLAVGSNIITGTPDEELCILYYNGSSTLTVTASANIAASILSLDWSQTGTYISLGLSTDEATSRIKVYQHKVYNGTITAATSVAENTAAVNSVGWNYDGTKLAVGRSAGAGTEFRTYSFNKTTPALSLLAGIESTTNITTVRYDRTGVYLARGEATNQYLSIYKPIDAAYFFQDANVFFNSDVSIQTPLSFKGLSTLDGQGNNLIFTGDGGLGIKPGAYVTIKNATLKCQKPGIFAFEAKDARVKFENSTLWLDSDLTLGDGSFEVFGNFVITGTHTLTYASGYTSTINAFSILSLENGAGLKVGKTRSWQPLAFQNNTSQLKLDNATLYIYNNGLQVTKGNIEVNGKSFFDVTYTRTDKGLIFGDGTNLANDPLIEIMASSELNIRNGGVTFNTITEEPINFSGNTSVLSVEPGGTLAIARNVLLDTGCLQLNDTSNVLIGSGKYFTANDSLIKLQTTKEDFYVTGTMVQPNTIILGDGDSMILKSGAITQDVVAKSGGSTIGGLGNFQGTLTLNDRLTTVTWNLLARFNAGNATLNGGRIYFTQDSGVDHGYELLTTGTIKLNGNSFEFGAEETTWTSTLCFDGDNSFLKLKAPLKLTSTWTFSGNTIFDLDRNVLTLGPTGNIVVERGSTLQFKKAIIENASGNNIRCTDDAGTIIYSDAKLSMHDNCVWDKGTLKFWQDNILHSDLPPGENFDLSYTSPKTSEIAYAASLKLDSGVNLKIGRVSGSSSTQPLAFDDVSSVLQLNGGSLTVTSSGMTLTKGTLQITGNSEITVESNPFNYAFVIGDGTAANDGFLKIDAGALLTIKNGKVFYNGSFPSSGIKFTNNVSAIRIESVDGLTAYRDLTLTNGTLKFPTVDYFGTQNNANFTQDNIVHIHDSPLSVHRIKGSFKTDAYYLLSNGDYFYSLEGSAHVPMTYIAGSASLGGSGLIGALQTINHSGITLKTSLSSILNNNIMLNGGTLYLENNLVFAADKKITGSGTINLNQQKLSFGTEVLTLTDTWYINSGSGIDLNAKTNLSGEWVIDGNLNLNGHGNILDLSNGGKLRIRPNSTLFLTDTIVKGLGLNNSGFIFMDDTAQLRFNNDFLELENSISTTIGGVYIEGPTTIGHKNYDWTFDSAASLTVDGVSLWQDPLGSVNHGKIKFGSGTLSKYLSLVSTGTIKTMANLDVLTTDTTDLAVQVRVNSNYLVRSELTNSNMLLYLNQRVRTDSNLLFKLNHDSSNSIRYLDQRIRNDSNTLINSIVNNGATIYSTHYNAAADTTIQNLTQFRSGITVASTKTLTLNTPLPVAGNLNFGDGTGKIALQNDLLLGTNAYITSSGYIDGNGYSLILTSSMVIPASKALHFSSNTVIDGGFNDFELSGSAALQLDAATTLTLRNMNLIIKPGSLITLANSTSKLALQNVTLYMDGDFTFNTGNLFIHEDVVVRGTTQFKYSSTSPMFITRNAMFYFDVGSKFKYIPGGGTSHASRNLINMYDPTSILYMDSASLIAPVNGLQLTKGSIILDNRVYFDNYEADGTTPNTDVAKAITFGDAVAANDVNVFVLAGARTEVTGYLDYNNAN